MRLGVWALGGLLLAAAPAAGQELPRLAGQVDGPVRFAYPARPGVCGAGDGLLIREADGSTTFVSGRLSQGQWRQWREGDAPCEEGDVVVTLGRTGGPWSGVAIAVGDRAPVDRGTGATALGRFTGAEAATFLLDGVASVGRRDARDLILAAALADAESWPRLLELARDRSLHSATRKTALHWVGRQAAEEGAAALGGIVGDPTESDEIRAAAVFALSQLPPGRAVPLLIRVARTTDDARVRSRALFWLAQFDDARAVALFEEILSGR